jgi:Leucine-rich repeat (LRR) protein/sugar lactone lactonase YvrE
MGILFSRNRLSALTNLQSLNVTNNQLTGAIPDLSALTNLQSLSFATNQLSGEIPNLSALTSLEKIYFGDNQLTGTIPNLTGLTNLRNVHFADNKLTGQVPNVNHLTHLETLSLNANQLSGTFPDVNNLTQLKWLKFGDNAMSGSIPNLSTLTSLEILYLSNNQFTGAIPDLSALTSLTSLALTGNQLCQDADADYGDWTEVEEFLSCDDPNYGLVLHLPFDGNANDASNNGRDGTEHGQINYVAGVSGQAVQFNGNLENYITVAHEEALNFKDSFTISFWLYRLADLEDYGPNVESIVIGKGRDCFNSYLIALNGQRFQVKTEAVDCQDGSSFRSAYTPVPLKEWHFMTAVFDKPQEKIKYYLDGVLKAQNNTVEYQVTNDYPLVIGQLLAGDAQAYPAMSKLDELHLHSRALSEAEIQSLYNAANPPQPVIMLEDAEDGNTTGWRVFENYQGKGAGYTNVYDSERKSQVIEFTGHWNSGYELHRADGSEFNETNNFVARWTVKETATVYWQVTTSGHVNHIVYRIDAPVGCYASDTNVICGLDATVRDGQWHTITRDLAADLKEAYPDFELQAVDALKIRSGGRLDDVQLINRATLNTYTIIGNFTDNGQSVSDAAFLRMGAQCQIDNTGYFECTVPEGWVGSLIPEHSDTQFFQPTVLYYEGVTENLTEQDFTAQTIYHGLLGYWNFNDCDATDNSGNGFDGIIHSEPTCVDGVIGKGFKFDGTDDFIEINGGEVLANPTITVAGWAYKKADTKGVVLEKIDRLYRNGDNYKIGIGNGKTEDRNTDQDLGASYELGDEYNNQWIHTAFVLTTEYRAVYVNGELKSKENLPEGFVPYMGDAPLQIGGTPLSNHGSKMNYFFNSMIDEVYVYNRALTDAEIEVLANPTRPVAHYCFDDPDNLGKNCSGDYNHGILAYTDGEYDVGVSGNAIRLDGVDDFVNISAVDSEFMRRAFTIITWFKPNEIKEKQAVVWFQDGQPSMGMKESGVYYGFRSNSSLPPDLSRARYVGSHVVHTDDWNCAVYTYDASDEHTLRHFLNGFQIFYGNLSENFIPSKTGTARIGRDDSINRSFNGLIDEVEIYNYVLSEEDIQTHCPQKPNPEKLVAHYCFDDPDNLGKNCAANGHHGTVQNGATSTEGVSGNAIALDGQDDFVTISNLYTYFMGNAFTIAAWFKPNELKARNEIFWFQDDQPSMNLSHDKVHFKYKYGDEAVHRIIGDGAADNQILPVGEWNCAVYSYDGYNNRTAKYFLNGNQIGERTLEDYFVPTQTGVVKIGGDDAGEDRTFNGAIDEVRLYNYSLSDDEVQAICPVISADEIMLEDAEDGDTENWSIFYEKEGGAAFTNVFDEDRNSQVIDFAGNPDSAYRFIKPDGSPLTTNNFIARWSMKIMAGGIGNPHIDKTFWKVKTTGPVFYMEYRTGLPLGCNNNSDEHYAICGLGYELRDGKWHNITRDLKADLKATAPDLELLSVEHFQFNMVGRVDDIQLLNRDVVNFHTISGTATNDIQDISDQSLVHTGADCQPFDNQGNFTCIVPEGWYGSLMPQNNNEYYFAPFTRIYSEVSENMTEQNFTAQWIADGLEDAEDGDTQGWSIYEDTKGEAAFANVVENENNRVIEFTGHSSSGYQFGFSDGTPFSTTRFIAQWRMKMTTTDHQPIYWRVKTSGSVVFLQYNANYLGCVKQGSDYIICGLGENMLANKWHTITRDLKADLKVLMPDLELLEVEQLHIRMVGQIDDIKLLESIPSEIVLEDAEDGNAQGLEIAEDYNASFSIVFDEEKDSQVLEFQGDAKSRYELKRSDGSSFNETNNFIVQWSAKGRVGIVSWAVETDSTVLHIDYSAYNRLGCHLLESEPAYVNCGIDMSMGDGTWHTFTRNLKADLKAAVPDANLHKIRYFNFRAGDGGRLDDIKLLNPDFVPSKTISGKITAEGQALNGVTFSTSGAECQASDNNGDFTCIVPEGWFGTLVPEKDGYLFEPFTKVYRERSKDMTAQNFIAKPIPTDDMQPIVHWTRDMHPVEGNGAVHLPYFFGEYVDENYTVMVRAKPTATKRINYLFHANDDRPGIIMDEQNRVRFAYTYNGTVEPRPISQTGSLVSEPLPLNEWIEVAATWDGTDYVAYVNGEQIGSATLPRFIKGTRVAIGWDGGTDRAFEGEIAEVKIYKRALTFFSDCNAVTEIPAAQCEALVALYDSTDGDNWTNNDGWKMTDTPCSWYGIACADGKVVTIELNTNNLDGTIPDLSALTDLRRFQLAENKLTGSLPQFNLFSDLESVWLSTNQLTGNIPELTGLTKLVSFHIWDNQLTGTIPNLSSLTQLQNFDLGRNQLTGNIPELKTLTQIQRLNLVDNQLEGPIPDLLASWPQFYISGNPLCQNLEADYAGRTEVEDFPICPDVKLIAEASTVEACIGQHLTVTIKKQLAQTINQIQMVLSYDANLLRVNTITDAGTLSQFKANDDNGTVQIDAGNFTGVSNEFDIVTLQLVPLAASVLTAVQFNDSQTTVKLNGTTLRHESEGVLIAIKDCHPTEIIIEPEEHSAIWTLIDKTAGLNAPKSISFDTTGNAYIADSLKHRILKRDTQGNITVVAGTKVKGFSGDNGPAIEAKLNNPQGIAIDGEGNLYIADTNNHRIRKVDSNGIITTVVGNGRRGFAGDNGLATAARLRYPVAIVFDNNGHLYITDSGNHRIRKVTGQRTRKTNANSMITTFAGSRSGYRGDNGPATQARLSNPSGLAVDSQNNLYIADTDNHRIRKVDNRGNITTVAGNGTKGYSGDGDPAIAAKLNAPTGLEVDSTGNLFIADKDNHRIRKVNNEGMISTFTGTGRRGNSTDGILAGVAQINQPTDVALDQYGNLYIADKGNNLIRKVGEKEGEAGEAPPHQIADCPNTDITGIPESECYALIALYDSTNGPEWTNNAGWKATDTPCEWTGVTCANGSVTEINLNDNNLVGDVPDQIGGLINLEQLNLNDNQISGAIPTTIEHLNKLETLNLANNDLIGSLPVELGDATNLQTVNLANNQISGEIPDLSPLTQMQTLNLSDNRLSGAVPDLTELTALQTVEIGGENQQLCQDSDTDVGDLPVGDLDECPTSNQLPTAIFTTTPNKGEAPLTVQLDGRSSHDPYGNITAYFWESSDKQVLIGPTPTITFQKSGTYEIKLRVMDHDGAPSINVAKHLIEVSPSPEQVTFILDKDGTGLGTISIRRDKEPAIACRANCQDTNQDYPIGSELRLTARAAKGSFFTGWRGDCVGTEENRRITVKMDSTKQCTAVFELEPTPPPAMHALTIDSFETMGSGGNVKVKGILCEKPPCVSYHQQSRNIKITAVPTPHAYFIGWNRGCPVLGEFTDATNLVVLTGDATCIAYFGNDSDPAAEDTAKYFEQEAELETGEDVNEIFPPADNRERYEQAFRFAEKAMMTVEDQMLLDEQAWPEHFNDIENWFDPLPNNLYVKKVQIKSGENLFEDGVLITGNYVHVEVLLLNKDGEEELVSILVYYDEEPQITEETTLRKRRGRRRIKCKK